MPVGGRIVKQASGVSLELRGPTDLGPDRIDAELRELSRLLVQVGLAIARLPAESSPPPNTRGAASDALGTLLIPFATSSAALTAAVKITVSWLRAKENRSVILRNGNDELELRGQGVGAQNALIESWLNRQGAHDEESANHRD
jgi:hypothetical protein